MDHLDPGNPSRNQAVSRLQQRLRDSPNPLEGLFPSAGLLAWGEAAAFGSWPQSLSGEDSLGLASFISSRCAGVIEALRSRRGPELATAVRGAQDACWLLQADLASGCLLEVFHDALEGVIHECGGLVLDDEAAVLVEEFRDVWSMNLLPPRWVLPVVRNPLGETQLLALASDPALTVPPVTVINPVPRFARELVFDGGRPSPRMIENFQNRQGRILCADGTQAGVRAILEPDWRISVEFDADELWCDRIDSVRIGVLTASTLDEDRDTWIASLGPFGLDTQTRLVGQPIVVALASGERFSI